MRIIDYNMVRRRQQLRAKKHRRVRRGFVAMALAVLLVGYGYIAYQRPLPLAVASLNNLSVLAATTPALSWPDYGQAALANDKYGVLATHGEQKPTPTASVAKVMTALAVLKKMPLAKGQSIPVITIDEVDVAAYEYYAANDGSLVRVELSEQITQYQALQALLLPSANNMAETLARWAFGSLDAYVAYANELAKELGMPNSHFADASGFSPDTVSTAHDLVVLGLAAMREPTLSEIVSQAQASIPVAGTVTNTNVLLGQDGIVGIKTGNTDQAGGCYLFAGTHTYDNGLKVTVVGAIVAAPSLGTAMTSATGLLASAYNGFGDTNIGSKDQKVADFRFLWFATNQAVLAEDLKIFGWKGVEATIHLAVDPLDPKQTAASQVGTLSVGTFMQQKTVPVILKNDTAMPPPSWRLKRLK